MIPSDTFHKHEAFYIVSKLLENSIAAMELICVKVGSRKLNFIVSICLEKFCRQRQLFYLLCFKAFQKHLWNDYCGVLFSNGWRKYSVTSAEMNLYKHFLWNVLKVDTAFLFILIQSFSFELTIVELFFKKLQEAVSVTVPEMNPNM